MTDYELQFFYIFKSTLSLAEELIELLEQADIEGKIPRNVLNFLTVNKKKKSGIEVDFTSYIVKF